ncbi:MAG: PVC-type heme-binding CxxCH protein [Phycisphaeraceae bacterium]
MPRDVDAAEAGQGEDSRLRVMWLGDEASHRPPDRARQLVPAMLDRDIEIHYTQNMDALTYPTMDAYDALIIYANIEQISAEQEAALLRYVDNGGGLVAIHSASFCFHNSDDYIELVGAQFQSHGAGVFRTRVVEDMPRDFVGYEGFESWDESYVHHRHNEDRTVIEYREDEPYTWLRTHGDGRVFYTAWGHDQRTFAQPEFHDLIERGIRWSVKQDVPKVLAQRELHQPFEYVEQDVPFYAPGGDRSGDSEWQQMQLPLSPEDSQRRYILPAGFELQLFAAEPDIRKPIAMAWDERGRLWIAETQDYPNEIRPQGEGRDRISILEDTTGDGKADSFQVFAEGLNIPTSLTFANGGVIVQQAPHTLFLKDTTGDGKADVRQRLITGWHQNDTHAGPSNMQYGLDNWIWGTTGYAGFAGEVNGERQTFGMGVHRFKPDGSALEFLRRTNNNTWGLGFSEEGSVFPSTANNNPSDHMPIARRYYDRVHDLEASTLNGIADRARFLNMTRNIRQVDVHGGYTSAAGHALYTARTWPKHYWNRVAFVTDPTGNLVGEFLIDGDGADYRSHNPSNLLASDDEWASPIMAEVGPDGHVWVLDWYAFIVQHNPTPAGHETGDGNAYVSDLRDRRHGRIYRIVYTGGDDQQPLSLHNAEPQRLVETLRHHNLLWRRHAQRLLVERGDRDVAEQLITLVEDQSVDAIGLNVGAIHALWTLHGLGAIELGNEASGAAVAALRHPSAGVRRNAVQVLPTDATMAQAILEAGLIEDDDVQVRLAALLALADQPHADAVGRAVYQRIAANRSEGDRIMDDALTFAAVQHIGGFLAAAHADPSFHTAHEEDEAEDVLPNQLANLSFTDLENGSPAGWSIRNYQGVAAHRVDEGREQGHAVRISSESGSDTSWYTNVEVQPGTRYRLSGWIRTENIATQGNAHGALFNVHELQGAEGARTTGLEGDNDWTRVETSFNSGNRTSLTINALFGGWGSATGTAWFDDVQLVALESAPDDRAQRIVGRVETHARAQAGGGATDHEVVIDGDTRVIELGVLANLIRFDQETITVDAGQDVRLTFTNNDHMQHNLLILKPDSLERVGQLADQMIGSAEAIEQHYVPKTDDVLFATPMVNPHEAYTLTFTAPQEPGRYPFVCTFPGHWRIMNGILIVE